MQERNYQIQLIHLAKNENHYVPLQVAFSKHGVHYKRKLHTEKSNTKKKKESQFGGSESVIHT